MERNISTTIVSYHLSTSNHNSGVGSDLQDVIVSYHLSTSNHNDELLLYSLSPIVSYHLSTSNHNAPMVFPVQTRLYRIIFLHQTTMKESPADTGMKLYRIIFLHQTTIWSITGITLTNCIVSSFYIKPQSSWSSLS